MVEGCRFGVHGGDGRLGIYKGQKYEETRFDKMDLVRKGRRRT